MNSTDYDRALAYLYSRINYERVTAGGYGAQHFKLDRMHELLAAVGNPHYGMPIVHVAGTKGKGSTSAMIAAALTAAGRRTGLFTSPHLVNLEERIAIDGEACTAEDLVALVELLRPAVERMDAALARHSDDCGPTYFELTTVMALLHFAQRRVGAAVLEVGLGGRLDSTNVCQPAVSVITSISFDHTKQLGNTLGEIAFEKAGIIKPGVPVVSGVTRDEPLAVIERVCRERGSRLVQLGRDFDYQYFPPRHVDHYPHNGKIDFRHITRPEQSCDDVPLGLLGAHQGANAAVALAVLAELRQAGWAIPASAARAGIAAARAPARVEVISRRPTIVIDTAHNVASIEALVRTLDDSFAPQPRVLIFATTQDKDVRGMMAQLLPRFEVVLLTRYRNNPRGVPVDELMAIARELSAPHCRKCDDPTAAWDTARALLTPDHLLCVTGSFFTAAELRQQIERWPLDCAAPAARRA